MCLLVESIRADDGDFDDLAPHNERISRSRRELFKLADRLPLERALEEAPMKPGEGRWKVRVLYDRIIRSVEASPYLFHPFRSAALIDAGHVEYSHKTVQRDVLDDITRRAAELGADAALIVSDNRITDFSWANAAFFDGSAWWTPQRPLLCGTRRARLLTAGLIRTSDLRPGDLGMFEVVSPINAMLDLGEFSISVRDIIIPEDES